MKDANLIATPQPAPVDADGDVMQELIDSLSPGRTREVLVERRRFGIEKYGKPVQRGNGRDHLWDLAQEFADAAVYGLAANKHVLVQIAIRGLELTLEEIEKRDAP